MNRHTLFLTTAHLRRLAALGKTRGLTMSSMVRLAISEFLRRETARDARQKAALGE